MADEDPLAKWRRPGLRQAQGKESDGATTVPSPTGIRPREYKAFVSDMVRVPILLLKCGLVKKAEAEIAVPYGYLTKVISDGYGFGFSLTFSLPFPSSAMVVEIRGEGLTPLLDGILSGTVKSVQLFDPDRFLPPKEGDFNIEADEWRGPCVVKDLSIVEKGSQLPSNTRH